jgi:hypothetical protein
MALLVAAMPQPTEPFPLLQGEALDVTVALPWRQGNCNVQGFALETEKNV